MMVLKQLMDARIALQGVELKKSGLNKFAGYSYFELGDFLPTVQTLFRERGLSGVVSFGSDKATLTISHEDGSAIAIECPMSEANLKGCHPVQNLGAVLTYTRRYLWVTAMEIVEHDAIDSSKPTVSIHTATDGALIDPKRLPVLKRVAAAMVEAHSRDDIAGAYEESEGITDAEERTALWNILQPHSACRSAVKAYKESLKGKV